MIASMKAWILLLTLAGCAGLPRDPDGTLDRVTREHRVRIGLVDGGAATAWRGVVERIAASAGARPVVRHGMVEPLLLDLEAGDLDLVVGARFDRSTPWVSRVSLGPPLAATKGDRSTAEHVVARNGENAWIMLVERAARADAR